jgi:NAD(P)-dependent dehydrogenase (short-subunit alcohol dehydrogenase family)
MSRVLEGRVALVTGASRGIGAAIARALARAGAHVVAVARTVGGLEEVDDAIRRDGGSTTLVPLDLKDSPAIDRLAAALQQRYGKLDVFVGNAGILGTLSPLAHVEPKVWDDVMAINVTANWRLIRALDPLLRASDAGRVILISSGVANSARAYWAPYSVSKAALEVLGRTYADETASTPVKVNLVNPGPVRTKMRAAAMPGEDPLKLDPPHKVAEQLLQLCVPSFAESGKLYDYPSRKLLSFQKPA